MDQSAFLTASDGTRIWYGTLGKGPALVLCDGLACDGFIWPYIIDHFVEEFTIVRWHYRGHGSSDVPTDLDTVTMEQFCRDIDQLLDTLGIDEAIFAGHSMGVQVILNYAGYRPERVRALIPMCGSYKHLLDTFHGTDLLRRALPLLDKGLQAAPEAIQAVWKTLLPRQIWYQIAVQAAEVNGRLLRQKDFTPYLEHAADMDLSFFLRLLNTLAEDDTELILKELTIPTLVIAGEKDTFTPMYRSTEMAELVEDSEFVIVPGGTHVAPLELPDLVIAAMEKFLMKRGMMSDEEREVLEAQ